MERIKRIYNHTPIPARVIFLILPISVCLHVLFSLSSSFAESYRTTVGAFFRSLLAYITNPLPFSLAELMLISVPFVLTALVVVIFRSDGGFAISCRIISSLLSVVTLVYTLFTLTFAAGFYTEDVGKHYGLERRDITVNELYSAALITVDELNAAFSEIDGKGIGATTMGMTYGEMNDRLLDAFDKLYEDYSFPSKLTSRAKPIALSEPMTYTHISGIYTFFTGEANININYPDFIIPYTAAHELSHQRGVSREDEANFVAFLVCAESDDPYIRYSGYLNMYQYMTSALRRSNPELYAEVYGKLDTGIVQELIAYSNFFDKYRDSTASKVSGTVNDTYLTIMSGTDSKSYGMVVDLATLYLISD